MSVFSCSKFAGGLVGAFVLSSVAFAGSVPGVPRAPKIEGQPAIHITREAQNPSQRQVIQAGYEICLLNRENLIKYKNSSLTGNEVDRALWAQTEESLRKDRPNYVVGKALAKAPDWEKVAVKREDEYFFKEKHAIYRYREEYDLIDDGSCAYKRKKVERADIDDGETRYLLDLVKKTGVSMPSPVGGTKMSRQELRKFAKDHPGFARDLSRNTFKINSPGPWSSLSDIEKSFDFLGTDNVASRQCDRYSPKGSRMTEICLWNQMYVYPGVIRRTIVLKSTMRLGKLVNVEKATKFVLSDTMDERVFKVPPGFTLNARKKKANSPPGS